MKYDERLYNLSADACSIFEEGNALDEEIVKKKQVLLGILFKRFQEQIELDKDNLTGTIKISLESKVFSYYDEGFPELNELVEKGLFTSFATDYCITIGEYEVTTDDYGYGARYDVLWDYKTYYEQMSREAGIEGPKRTRNKKEQYEVSLI